MGEQMDEYITKHFRGMDALRNAVVKWVRSPDTMVALLCDTSGADGRVERGYNHGLRANYGHK